MNIPSWLNNEYVIMAACLSSIFLVGGPLLLIYCFMRRERNRWSCKLENSDGGFEKSDSFEYYAANSIGFCKATSV